MSLSLQWANAFLLLIPLLGWNLLLSPKLPDRFRSVGQVHAWAQWLEHVARAGAFIAPLFIPLGWTETHQVGGLVLFGAGTLIYFASWLPLLVALD